MLSEEALKTIRKAIKFKYDEHVSQLLSIPERHLDKIIPNKGFPIVKILEGLNADTAKELREYGHVLQTEIARILEKLGTSNFSEEDKELILHLLEDYCSPDIYKKRFDIMLNSIERKVKSYGMAFDIQDYRPDIPKSCCDVGAENSTRRIKAIISNELNCLVVRNQQTISTNIDTCNPPGSKEIPMKIFVSYAWDNSTIADTLDILFNTKNIRLERDVRDIDYKQSIKEFMKRVRISDYCLMIISDNYLRSINCMFEVTEFIKDESYIDRILPLVKKDADIFNILIRNKYVKFWQDKYIEVESSLSDIDKLNSVETINELKKIENIQRNIGEFLSTVSSIKTVTFDNEISKSDFDKIYSAIYPTDGFLNEYKDIDGYFVLNIPRTLTDKTLIWWRLESKGYTDELNHAKVFTKSEIDEKMKGDPRAVARWCKKYAAIPINEVAVKLGQNYIPLNGHFRDILYKFREYIIGNRDIYLDDNDIEMLI